MSAIESLLVAAGVSEVIGWVDDEVNSTTTQEDIDVKVGQSRQALTSLGHKEGYLSVNIYSMQ